MDRDRQADKQVLRQDSSKIILCIYYSFMTEVATPAFDEFCQLLGTRVPLKDWKGFRGGLDVKSKFF